MTDPISARLLARHPQKIDLSLDRMRALMVALGDPQARLPPVVHVAGTNGKGSTVALLRAMAEAAGLRVHVYTSPHLVRFNERIRLAGTLIDDAALGAVLDRVEGAGVDATVFEATTAAGLLAMAETPQTWRSSKWV
jgi:dihydrofolate synthase/folylpolyglutamate synthase